MKHRPSVEQVFVGVLEELVSDAVGRDRCRPRRQQHSFQPVDNVVSHQPKQILFGRQRDIHLLAEPSQHRLVNVPRVIGRCNDHYIGVAVDAVHRLQQGIGGIGND